MDAEQVKECVRQVLEERTSVGPEKHQTHHNWMDVAIPKLDNFFEYHESRMQEIERRRKVIEFAKQTAIGVVVVTVVGGLFTVLAWIGKVVLIALSHGGVQQ